MKKKNNEYSICDILMTMPVLRIKSALVLRQWLFLIKTRRNMDIYTPFTLLVPTICDRNVLFGTPTAKKKKKWIFHRFLLYVLTQYLFQQHQNPQIFYYITSPIRRPFCSSSQQNYNNKWYHFLPNQVYSLIILNPLYPFFGFTTCIFSSYNICPLSVELRKNLT